MEHNSCDPRANVMVLELDIVTAISTINQLILIVDFFQLMSLLWRSQSIPWGAQRGKINKNLIFGGYDQSR